MQEKFVIQSLMVFLEGALKRGKLKKDFVERQKKKCLELLKSEEIEGINQIIEEVNKALPAKDVPYPLYDVSAPVYEVQGQIFAFQYFLRNKLEEKRIKLDQQMPLFRHATRLWAHAGDTVPPNNGIKEFAKLIEKTNGYLPENERYPTLEEEK